MQENMFYIQPCCVEKVLPKAIHNAPRGTLSFYTRSDVTMEGMYKAVSWMLDSVHVMALSMPDVTPVTAAYLSLCFERGWISDLILSTSRETTPLIDKYMSAFRNRILYRCSPEVSYLSSHMVLYSNKRALIIEGPMYDSPVLNNGLASYTAIYMPSYNTIVNTKDYANPLLNSLYPDIMRMRMVKPDVTRLSNNLVRFINRQLPPYTDEE